MVGHTHKDIDKSFSCLSRLLRKVDSLTVAGTAVCSSDIIILYTLMLSICTCYRYGTAIQGLKSDSSWRVNPKLRF